MRRFIVAFALLAGLTAVGASVADDGPARAEVRYRYDVERVAEGEGMRTVDCERDPSRCSSW